MTNYDMADNQQTVDIIGKKWRLSRFSETAGKFSMLAKFQRQSLRQIIFEKTGKSQQSVSVSALKQVKRVVTASLSVSASAVLTDSLFGYDAIWDVIPGATGVKLSIEQTGFATVKQSERLTRLLRNWKVQRAHDAGADGIKLLIWYNKSASEATLEYQINIVSDIGNACSKHTIPFVLGVVCYPFDRTPTSSSEYANTKAMHVIDATASFSVPEFDVDLLKLEFLGNLIYAKENQKSSFHGGVVVNELSGNRDYFQQIDNTSRVPWMILIAGVESKEFVENITLSNDAGASGFLSGQAIWKDISETLLQVTGIQPRCTALV